MVLLKSKDKGLKPLVYKRNLQGFFNQPAFGNLEGLMIKFRYSLFMQLWRGDERESIFGQCPGGSVGGVEFAHEVGCHVFPIA